MARQRTVDRQRGSGLAQIGWRSALALRWLVQRIDGAYAASLRAATSLRNSLLNAAIQFTNAVLRLRRFLLTKAIR